MRIISRFLFCSLLAVSLCTPAPAADNDAPKKLTVLVMDPLSAPLACDCVQGYAQRKYEHLGEYLQRTLKMPVTVVWSESMATSEKENGAAQIVIGKHSVVQHEAKSVKQKFRPVAQLTGLDGSVQQTGLIVVRKDDTAQTVDDLKGYRILFGPKDCDEKHKAIVTLLEKSDIDVPAKPEISAACSEAATTLMEMGGDVKAAAVISSYAKPLLAGCGTIKKGDLRVVAETEPVPFISAFVAASLPKEQIQQIRTALLDVELEPKLMIALESGEGFKRWKNPNKKKKTAAAKTAAKKK